MMRKGLSIPISLFILLVLSTPNTMSLVSAQNPSCTPQSIESQVIVSDSGLNQNQAISLARLSLSSISNLVSSETNFTNIANIWHQEAGTCSVTWKSVNAYFATTFANGSVGYIIVSESPDLSHVISVGFQQGGIYGSSYILVGLSVFSLWWSIPAQRLHYRSDRVRSTFDHHLQ